MTSIDREGTCKGFDVNLVRTISTSVSVHVISSGGMGTTDHLAEVVRDGSADAVAMAHVLHFKELDLSHIQTQVK